MILESKPNWIRRVAAIVIASLAALVCRTIAVNLFDIDFISYGGELGHEAIDVGIRPALVVPAIAGLLGWAALAILERTIKPVSVVWTTGAVLTLLASVAPLIPWSMPGDTKAVLICMHVVVAAIYIPLMRATISPRTK